jgi:hypothetical protein
MIYKMSNIIFCTKLLTKGLENELCSAINIILSKSEHVENYIIVGDQPL